MEEETIKPELKYVQVAVEKGERTYKFLMPDGAPLGEAFDASMQTSKILVQIAQESLEKSKEVKQEQKKE